MGFIGSMFPGLAGGNSDLGTAGFLAGPLGDLTGGNTPQQHGYGINRPTEFTPYSTGPGLQDGNGSGMEGMDLTQRGPGEQFFGATAGSYLDPGAGEDFFKQTKGQYGQAGMGENFAKDSLGQFGGGKNPKVSENSQSYFQEFNANKPSVAEEPGFGAYYDRAKTRSASGINKQLAARGLFGSTGGMDQIGQAMTDLDAQQANREADYNLSRLGEQRQWESLGGNLAGQADSNSMNQSQNALSWMQGLGNLANAGQGMQMSRLGQGQDAANAAQTQGFNRLGQGQNFAFGAQDAGQGRAQQLFNNNMGMGGALSNQMMGAYNDMLGMDQMLMDSGMGMELGLGAEALNQDRFQQQDKWNQMSNTADLFGSAMGGFMGK